ncbi:MAG TPA: transglutaminase family protein [Afifellaceae bacterium]|nr:transglutaminase family protein [Afifellaceae bacterium]
MQIEISTRLHYRFSAETDVLLQVEAAATGEQVLKQANIEISDNLNFWRISGEEGIGDRIWITADADMTCDYSARVNISRTSPDLVSLSQLAPHSLPVEAVRYLLASRYCPSDEFQNFVRSEFGSALGGARIAAMREWVAEKVNYVSGASNADTTALDTFVQRQGVCRDFAHLVITFARASGIPARMASVYAPGVEPQDFHAVAQVYLDDAWHLVDATGMAGADEIAIIGVGRDAADISFMTSFGGALLIEQSVKVEKSGGA